jgi:putative hydrolases of HD superfamily
MIKKNRKLDNENIYDFFAESGLLKRVKRSGWWVVGIKDPESVAEHCYRCAVIGYVLAKMEQADAHSVTMMCLFNDLHEARINDAHKVASTYLNYREAEDKAFFDQIKDLPETISSEMGNWRKQYTKQENQASIIARDADIFECLIQAKEYSDQGHTQAKIFFKKAPTFLKTKSAKKLWKHLRQWHSSHWWQKISEFER